MSPAAASAGARGPGAAAAGEAARCDRAAYGPTLVLTVTLALAGFLLLMSAVLLVVHPARGAGVLSPEVILQRQSAKTGLYLASFLLVLPLALIAGPRVADKAAAGAASSSLPALAGALAGALAALIIVVRVSASLPWGDGLGAMLAAMALWWALALVALAGAVRGPRPALLARLEATGRPVFGLAGVLLFGTLLCLTQLRSLDLPGVVLCAAAGLGAWLLYDRIRLRRIEGRRGIAIDVVVLVILLLAIPDTVVFHASPVPPSIYGEPGVIQFQQDWLLGPANQLLAGGALLVGDPVSQYGVGSIYFLAGWFHLAPIGYGTFGFLDGILTALFYVAAYGVLRIAGVTRVLAAGALALGVMVLIYHLHYAVGALPEQGPLRFGLPMLLILALTAAARWPERARPARGLALAVLGVSSIWALEGFAYTAFTFLAVLALEAQLRDRGSRRRWLVLQLGLGVAACLCAHVILAVATLADTGHLPDWGQYLAYIKGLLLGGKEGSITFGFGRWSPALAVGAAWLASAAALVLLVRRRTAILARERTTLIALGGMTAYALAMFSYTDNRSSTYLLLYVTLPTLLIGALWLGLVLRHRPAQGLRRGAVAFALSVAALMLAAAWPSIGGHFSDSVLAHAYPGGGLGSALHDLWHPPPLDPRAPEGERLLARYVPGRRVVILLPRGPDLSTEILMRSGRANRLFLADANQDTFVPSVWMPKISREISRLRAGERLLIDRGALSLVATLRAHPGLDPLTHPIGAGNPEIEWILGQIGRRFGLRPVAQGGAGFVVAELVRR